MAMQTVLTVDKATVSVLKDNLYKLIKSAQDISAQSTFEHLRLAKESLDIARGLFKALNELGLIDDLSITEEDLERVQRKHMHVLEDKRRSDRPRWKS